SILLDNIYISRFDIRRLGNVPLFNIINMQMLCSVPKEDAHRIIQELTEAVNNFNFNIDNPNYSYLFHRYKIKLCKISKLESEFKTKYNNFVTHAESAFQPGKTGAILNHVATKVKPYYQSILDAKGGVVNVEAEIRTLLLNRLLVNHSVNEIAKIYIREEYFNFGEWS
ncbi:MAG TPA: hypothetical protein VFP93_05410, partial [Gammaproteobacteria bacterium]|nr:hypothetical protein [Gammaproteobacteria bacterium]